MKYPEAKLVKDFLSESEPLFSKYKNNLDTLNKIIDDIGEPLEGNIFYRHLETNRTHNLIERFLPKRAALAMFAMSHDNIVEIGFNSGFSALLMLTANPNLKLTSVDICQHKYTEPCFQYLESVFPGRISLVKGDSTEVLVDALQDKATTGYIIDGGHGLDVAETDLRNVIQHANPGAVLCFDDSDFVELRMMLNMYMMSGHLSNFCDPYGPAQNQTQMFFKIVA